MAKFEVNERVYTPEIGDTVKVTLTGKVTHLSTYDADSFEIDTGNFIAPNDSPGQVQVELVDRPLPEGTFITSSGLKYVMFEGEWYLLTSPRIPRPAGTVVRRG